MSRNYFRGEDLVRRVVAAQAGDVRAFEELMVAFRPAVEAYCASVTGDSTLAEDAAQETFLRIHKRLAGLRKPEAFRNWMYRIAGHTAVALRRQRGFFREQRFVDIDGAAERMATIPARTAPDTGSVHDLRLAMGGMTPTYAGVLTLHYVRELSCPEIAEELGITTNNAKQRLFRARRALRRDMARRGWARREDGASLVP